MLPFLKKSQEAHSDEGGTVEMRSPDDGEFDSMHVAAQDLIDAIKAGSAKSAASALRAAFELCDSEPHTEGPHNG